MRSTIPFDTHAFVKKLVAAGVPERQAEVHAEMLVEVVVERLATKDDIELVRQDLRALEERIDGRLASIVKDMDGRFKDLDARFKDIDGRFKDLDGRFKDIDGRFKDLDGRFKDMELRLTLRMGAMLAAAVAIMTALVKLL